jgi:enoyl-CoA hydratase/carnithine racemase
VVKADKLIDEAMKLATQIAGKSPIQTMLIKSLVNTGIEIDLSSGCSLEMAGFSSSFSTMDHKEGMTAFLEKRKPAFTGK